MSHWWLLKVEIPGLSVYVSAGPLEGRCSDYVQKTNRVAPQSRKLGRGRRGEALMGVNGVDISRSGWKYKSEVVD